MTDETKSEHLRPGWKRGESGNPRGRPKGSRNRVTLIALAAMEEGAEAIARRMVELAKGGDIQAARLVLERLIPTIRERPVSLELPPDDGTAEGIAQVQGVILKAVCAGELLPAEAATLAGIVEARRRALETQEIERRLTVLEKNHGQT